MSMIRNMMLALSGGVLLLAAQAASAQAAPANTNASPAQAAAQDSAGEAFKAWDKDRNGSLSPVEVRAGWQQVQRVAEMQAQNAVHVEQAQMLTRPAGYAEAQRPILRLFHAASVILHEEAQIARVRLRPDFDIAVVHVANAVNHRVFHNRLKHQLHRTVVHYFLVYLKAHLKFVLIAHLLNIHVAFCVQKLIAYSYYGMSLRQTDT